MRINKFLAQAGIASRRKVDELIEEGRVNVNGKKATLGQEIKEGDNVLVNGQAVQKHQPPTYIILNKPKGVTSTVYDPHAQFTVTKLVGAKERLFPVGRLDEDSTGLILLTNDGELANRLTHPKFHIPKTYEVTILGVVTPDQINKLESGIFLEEGKTAPAKVEIAYKSAHKTILKITIFEGKKRQIRRMTASLHLHILFLKRISIGPIVLGNLPSGKFRKLTDREVQSLKKAANLLN